MNLLYSSLPLFLFLSFQSSSQPQSQTGDLGTTLTAASQSDQDTDTDQPPQQHSQEAGDAGALTASSGSPEQAPLVPVSEDGREHKDEQKIGKREKKKQTPWPKDCKEKMRRLGFFFFFFFFLKTEQLCLLYWSENVHSTFPRFKI